MGTVGSKEKFLLNCIISGPQNTDPEIRVLNVIFSSNYRETATMQEGKAHMVKSASKTANLLI